MSVVQFLRIFWARRLIILAATISCVVGALIAVLIIPPRWESQSRVMLDLVKPDPVTGVVIANNNTRAYMATQTQLITDYSVAGQVADQLGWLSDPGLIELYRKRSSGDVRDFRHWVAQRVIDRTKAKILEGSNILEITFTGNSANNAKAVADALRRAYIDTSVEFRREDAARNADWYAVQADKAKVQLDAAEAAEAAYERENGIIMQDEKTDVDSARLRALAAQAATGAPIMPPVAPASSAASIELAQIDAQISQASKNLGPNHPELQALRTRRSAVASLAAHDQAAARASLGAAASAAAAGAGAIDRAMQAQKSRVIAQRDKLGRLMQLQAEVDLRRDQYNKTAAKAADLRQQSAVAMTGLTILGSASTPQKPAFPNMPLILFGSLFLGLGTGVVVAFLVELFGRRVRGAEDLQAIRDVPLLAVIAPAARRGPREVSRRKAAAAGRPERRKLIGA